MYGYLYLPPAQSFENEGFLEFDVTEEISFDGDTKSYLIPIYKTNEIKLIKVVLKKINNLLINSSIRFNHKNQPFEHLYTLIQFTNAYIGTHVYKKYTPSSFKQETRLVASATADFHNNLLSLFDQKRTIKYTRKARTRRDIDYMLYVEPEDVMFDVDGNKILVDKQIPARLDRLRYELLCFTDIEDQEDFTAYEDYNLVKARGFIEVLSKHLVSTKLNKKQPYITAAGHLEDFAVLMNDCIELIHWLVNSKAFLYLRDFSEEENNIFNEKITAILKTTKFLSVKYKNLSDLYKPETTYRDFVKQAITGEGLMRNLISSLSENLNGPNEVMFLEVNKSALVDCVNGYLIQDPEALSLLKNQSLTNGKITTDFLTEETSTAFSKLVNKAFSQTLTYYYSVPYLRKSRFKNSFNLPIEKLTFWIKNHVISELKEDYYLLYIGLE